MGERRAPVAVDKESAVRVPLVVAPELAARRRPAASVGSQRGGPAAAAVAVRTAAARLEPVARRAAVRDTVGPPAPGAQRVVMGR